MENVVVVIGAGQIRQAIARRVAVGKHVVLADRSEANANAAAEVMVNAGYQVSVATFGKVMAGGGSGVVISSQSGHRLPALTVEPRYARRRRGTWRTAMEIAKSGSPPSAKGSADWFTTAMTHIAIAEMLDGTAVEWMEHVTTNSTADDRHLAGD